MKVVACLGNPGPEYSTTRHNVGWWLADLLAETWALGRFRREGPAAVAAGRLGAIDLRVLKPLTYMNRSGVVLAPLRDEPGFDPAADLLVVVDDVALEPGRARFRPGGSAGGHNGLRSVESHLGTPQYGRLRIGVGARPPGVDLADWVLASPPLEERRLIRAILPSLVDCVETWTTAGMTETMNRCNAPGSTDAEHPPSP